MRKIILVFLGLAHVVYAYSHKELLNDYALKHFEKVCSEGMSLLAKNERNETILVAIGDACARIDAINPLGSVVKNLFSTPQFRESGSYFSTLILQKKLIYQFMADGISLQDLRLPRTDHVLSRVFEELSLGNVTTVETKKKIVTPSREYLLWLSDDEPKRVYIDEIEEGQLLFRHWYL